MVIFSNDVDILKYEPILFGELHLPWQVLAEGTGGTLSGTSFTAEDADFVGAQVSAGGVVYLQSADGVLDGAYEIVSVDSAAELTVSVVRADSNSEPIAPPAAGDVSYHVSTFGPQAGDIGFQLTEYFGIQPGNPESVYSAEDVLDTTALKLASVFGIVSSVYAMLSSRAENENLWKKSLYYQKLFEKARQRCRLGLDVDSDGVADVTKDGWSVRLKRE
jgi:hypothetical protein